MLKLIKDNILELLFLIGMIILSIGFFMFSYTIGFIGTGTIIILFCCMVWKVNQEGGD